MSNQLQVFDNQQFGELINLPKILEQNKTSTLNATNAARPLIDTASGMDLMKVGIEEFDKLDVGLNDLYVKLDSTVKAQKERRQDFTQFFDVVRSLFIAEEKSVDSLKEEVKAIRNNWQREKLRREQERQAALQKEIDKKNEAIEIRAITKKTMYINLNAAMQNTIKLVSEVFYKQTLSSFAEYEPTLLNYKPSLIDDEIKKMLSRINMQLYRNHSDVEFFEIVEQEAKGLITELRRTFEDIVGRERDRLISLIPSRKMELERIANDAAEAEKACVRIQQEQEEQQRKLKEQADQQAQQQSLEADTAKMNTLFEVHGNAEPAIELAKGTSVKKAYKATTHAAHLALLQSWVKHDLPAMSIEDLNTKISFTRTACNKRLNEGEMLEANGLIVEEDVVTRGRKPKNSI